MFIRVATANIQPKGKYHCTDHKSAKGIDFRTCFAHGRVVILKQDKWWSV